MTWLDFATGNEALAPVTFDDVDDSFFVVVDKHQMKPFLAPADELALELSLNYGNVHDICRVQCEFCYFLVEKVRTTAQARKMRTWCVARSVR